MRSRQDYIVTKQEVHGYANQWLGTALRLEYEGRKCTGNTLIQILLIAAARVVSICAVCHDLADAPCDQTIRNALGKTLPEMPELEQRLNHTLATDLPKALRRKSRMIAIDLTLIPYHGEPHKDEKEIYRYKPSSGTTHFHAYASAVVVHRGYRYTLALIHIQRREAMKDILQRLLAIVRKCVKIKFLLLDKGFFSVAVISCLKRAGHAFIIPAAPRGRTPKRGKKHTGLRAILKKKHGDYTQNDWQRLRETADHRIHRLCGEQELATQEDRQTAMQEVALCGLESATHSAQNSRGLSQTIRHRNQLSPDERSPHSYLHARPAAATVVRRHRAGTEKRVGVAALPTCPKQVTRRAAVVPATTPLQGNAAMDHSSHSMAIRNQPGRRNQIPDLPTPYGTQTMNNPTWNY